MGKGQCRHVIWNMKMQETQQGNCNVPLEMNRSCFRKTLVEKCPKNSHFRLKQNKLKLLPWYNIPQSISFTANHFSLSRCCFYWPFIGTSSLLLFHCVLHIHLLFSFPAAKQRDNWIAPNRPPDKSISYSEFLMRSHSMACIFIFCLVSPCLIVIIIITGIVTIVLLGTMRNVVQLSLHHWNKQ